MLGTVAEHLRAEAASDLDGLKATLADSPDYHLWADGRDYGPKGMDAVLAYYGEVVAVKRQILEFDIERIVVDHDTVVTEGWIPRSTSAAVARAARGWEIDDDDASYIVSQRVVIFWPFDEEGHMLGEDGYANFDRTARASSRRRLLRPRTRASSLRRCSRRGPPPRLRRVSPLIGRVRQATNGRRRLVPVTAKPLPIGAGLRGSAPVA